MFNFIYAVDSKAILDLDPADSFERARSARLTPLAKAQEEHQKAEVIGMKQEHAVMMQEHTVMKQKSTQSWSKGLPMCR